MSCYLDEIQLSTDMETDANTAVADMSKNISKEVMIYGILTNNILVGATVLGFSRNGNYTNKELFGKKLEVYSITNVEIEDIEEIIRNHAKDPVQMKSIFQQIKRIGLNQILFMMKIMEHQDEDLGKIETATDLFLIILRGNLAFQSQKSDTTFSKLLNVKDKDLLDRIFQLCKENLQNEEKQAGVITGTVTDGKIWVPKASKDGTPLSFLKRVGMFEIPPTSYDKLDLGAQHLSFVEFFASVGILLNSDIKGGFKSN